MKDIIESNYASIVKRGLITPKTEQIDFDKKLIEECMEFIRYDSNRPEELADIILVCLNYAKHYGIDIEHELKRKIKINDMR